jgi:hypothetical protein
MDKKFVARFMENKPELKRIFSVHPDSYLDIVKSTISVISSDDSDDYDIYDEPDPERVVQVDHGDYQGTLVFVIASRGYQPSVYWYTHVWYGSCEACDLLKGIRGYDYDVPPNETQINDYLTLALHIVQKMKRMEF